MEPVPEFALDHKRLQTLREYGFVPTSVLDIGASNGVWSGTCAMIFPEADYFLVEPQQYPREYAPVPGIKRHWIRQAVGAKEETVELIVPARGKQSRFNAHVLPRRPGSLPRPTLEQIPVPQTTVDRLLETGVILPPQLVKVDVQGYELEVLRGGTRLWETAKVFFVETSIYRYWDKAPLLADVVAFFAERGFHVYDFSTECRMPRELLSQVDLIFVKRMSPEEMFEKIRQLRKENEYLKRQREILKKAMSILGEEPSPGTR
jgi:FkbM family methyltransferase